MLFSSPFPLSLSFPDHLCFLSSMKVDLVPPQVAVAWRYYFLSRFPELSVICFTSYPDQEASTLTSKKCTCTNLSATNEATLMVVHSFAFIQFGSDSREEGVAGCPLPLVQESCSKSLRECTEAKVPESLNLITCCSQRSIYLQLIWRDGERY